jgi:hypothetical protein
MLKIVGCDAMVVFFEVFEVDETKTQRKVGVWPRVERSDNGWTNQD